MHPPPGHVAGFDIAKKHVTVTQGGVILGIMSIANDLFCVDVEAIQITILMDNPEVVKTINKQAVNRVAAYGGGIILIMFERMKFVNPSIVRVEPVLNGTDPQVAVTIFNYLGDIVAGDRVRIC